MGHITRSQILNLINLHLFPLGSLVPLPQCIRSRFIPGPHYFRIFLAAKARKARNIEELRKVPRQTRETYGSDRSRVLKKFFYPFVRLLHKNIGGD